MHLSLFTRDEISSCVISHTSLHKPWLTSNGTGQAKAHRDWTCFLPTFWSSHFGFSLQHRMCAHKDFLEYRPWQYMQWVNSWGFPVFLGRLHATISPVPFRITSALCAKFPLFLRWSSCILLSSSLESSVPLLLHFHYREHMQGAWLFWKKVSHKKGSIASCCTILIFLCDLHGALW